MKKKIGKTRVAFKTKKGKKVSFLANKKKKKRSEKRRSAKKGKKSRGR